MGSHRLHRHRWTTSTSSSASETARILRSARRTRSSRFEIDHAVASLDGARVDALVAVGGGTAIANRLAVLASSMSLPLVRPVDSRYLVRPDTEFGVGQAPTRPPDDAPGTKENKKALKKARKALARLQRTLYADNRYAVLLVFQAMDAGGKDGTIRAVLRGVNPAGCQVTSFKQPSREELDHDFLWRVNQALPERGRIGVFNRSHYEEVLVVRVHPHILGGQRLPRVDEERVWSQRFDSIRAFERHLAMNGTIILKFWLNVSKDEQRRRFLDRIDEEDSNWKFSAGDVAERGRWDDYMHAYEEALRATSTSYAPWYAIPADDKPFMRRVVAEIVCDTVGRLDIGYPEVSEEARAEMSELRRDLAGG